ncbi:MAG: hypothetical protein LUB60_02045 [Clostridiales bacterium]|nr:hypothetical protein [Clostridiales bacterium]
MSSTAYLKRPAEEILFYSQETPEPIRQLEENGDDRKIQVGRILKETKKDLPRLSREEYVRLLSAARSKGRQRVYLVMKTLASTGIMMEDLPSLTVEAVRKGYLELPRVWVVIPDFLRRELLEYAAKKGITTGMVFQTRGGKAIDRSNLNHEVKALSAEANIPEEKCNPRCLRQLYQQTQKSIRDDVEILVEREFRRILENEQAVIGWDA